MKQNLNTKRLRYKRTLVALSLLFFSDQAMANGLDPASKNVQRWMDEWGSRGADLTKFDSKNNKFLLYERGQHVGEVSDPVGEFKTWAKKNKIEVHSSDFKDEVLNSPPSGVSSGGVNCTGISDAIDKSGNEFKTESPKQGKKSGSGKF